MLQVVDLNKSFVDGEHSIDVLNELNFDLGGGQSLAITGPSGSGKSTLLNLLAGILAPDRGQLTLNVEGEQVHIGHPSARVRTALRRSSIGYVHQFFNLIPTLTVLENIMLPAHLNRLADARERANELLERVDLVAKANVFPATLSGGQQQRVAVARALIVKPVLVLADEPTGNLDRVNAERVGDLLFSACLDQAAMLVVATHSEVVAQRADRRLELGLELDQVSR